MNCSVPWLVYSTRMWRSWMERRHVIFIEYHLKIGFRRQSDQWSCRYKEGHLPSTLSYYCPRFKSSVKTTCCLSCQDLWMFCGIKRQENLFIIIKPRAPPYASLPPREIINRWKSYRSRKILYRLKGALIWWKSKLNEVKKRRPARVDATTPS